MKRNNTLLIKYTGAGNDFLILDMRKARVKLSLSQRRTLVKKLCNRHFGIGADGFIFLERARQKDNQFDWDFYNDDGTFAEMCLNASRCVTHYELLRLRINAIKFGTRIGVVMGSASKKGVQVQIPRIGEKLTQKTIRVDGQKIKGFAIDSGVPHFLVQKNKLNVLKEKEVAREIRHHSAFKKRGTNVTYWKKTGSIVQAVTYERGVEDFTLACGTGAAAIGILFSEKNGKKSTTVKMPGGKIFVQIERKHVIVRGPAQKVFETQINLSEYV